jgi:formate hydrogenlyase transcriptional activator
MNDHGYKKLQQQADRYQALLKVAEAISVCRDLRELFRELTQCLPEVVDVNFVGLALYDPELKVMRLHTLQANIPVEIETEGSNVPLDDGPAGIVWKTQQPLLIQNLAEERRWPRMMQMMREDGVQSCVTVPLNVARRRLGVLGFLSVKRDAYGESDLEFLKQVANQVAVAVDNALAYQQIEALKNKLAKEKRYLEDEIRTGHNFEEITGRSPALIEVLKQVEIVAPTDATVLIQGETGTGKELIARAIHNSSGRRERTFVKINCAAIPTGLLESELFGHERGAFTNAIAQKVGRFELAHQGTLFLDEVGDISLELQSKLLRVLQEQEFERLGSTKTIKVNVRVVAATNRDLAQMIADKQFRTDLYYRLNIFPILLPPLRERSQDIPLLVRYFAQKYAGRMNKKLEPIPPDVIKALIAYPWPGNVRELENLIERSVILSQGPALAVPLGELKVLKKGSSGASTLEDAEREHIIRTLTEVNWVVGGPSGAAARLGIKRSTLQFKIKKLGIVRSA